MVGRRRLVGLCLVCAVAGLGQEAKPASDGEEGLAFLKLLMASQHLRQAKGCPEQGFFLDLENKTASDMQVVLAIPSHYDLAADLFGKKQEGDFVQGWWKLEPGAKRRVFIERALPQEYFLYARNAKNYWGKGRTFKVPCGDSEKAFAFTGYRSNRKCSIDAEGRVVCVHSFTESTPSAPAGGAPR